NVVAAARGHVERFAQRHTVNRSRVEFRAGARTQIARFQRKPVVHYLGGQMPEYLAPGVYVEEVSFRSKSIEGVSTTTTGFVGSCRYGPTELAPDVITSLAEFERVYGDGQQLTFKNETATP